MGFRAASSMDDSAGTEAHFFSTCRRNCASSFSSNYAIRRSEPRFPWLPLFSG